MRSTVNCADIRKDRRKRTLNFDVPEYVYVRIRGYSACLFIYFLLSTQEQVNRVERNIYPETFIISGATIISLQTAS